VVAVAGGRQRPQRDAVKAVGEGDDVGPAVTLRASLRAASTALAPVGPVNWTR